MLAISVPASRARTVGSDRGELLKMAWKLPQVGPAMCVGSVWRGCPCRTLTRCDLFGALRCRCGAFFERNAQNVVMEFRYARFWRHGCARLAPRRPGWAPKPQDSLDRATQNAAPCPNFIERGAANRAYLNNATIFSEFAAYSLLSSSSSKSAWTYRTSTDATSLMLSGELKSPLLSRMYVSSPLSSGLMYSADDKAPT